MSFMKYIIIPCLSLVAFVFLSACTTVEEKPATHTTTVTEESRIHGPVSATSTTETRSVRSY